MAKLWNVAAAARFVISISIRSKHDQTTLYFTPSTTASLDFVLLVGVIGDFPVCSPAPTFRKVGPSTLFVAAFPLHSSSMLFCLTALTSVCPHFSPSSAATKLLMCASCFRCAERSESKRSRIFLVYFIFKI